MEKDLKNILPNLSNILKNLRCKLGEINIKTIDNFYLSSEGSLVLEYTDFEGPQSFNVNLSVLEKLEIQYNVLNYNELNSITDAELYAFAYVRQSQGVQFINYRGSGLYIWDGTAWTEDDSDVFTQLQSLIDTLALIQNQITSLENSKLDKGSYTGNASDLDDDISIEAAERASGDSILELQINNHVNDNNPHNVTSTQLGLENVDNTSDLDKPISNATQLELDDKVDSSSLGATAFSNDYKDLDNLPTITNGTDGKSAYEIALDEGFTGTISQWITSLQGADGPQGIQGIQGIDGLQGNPGVDGQNGIGITSTVDNGNGTFTITYTNNSTFTTGDFTGPQGINGESAYQIAVNNGFIGNQADWLLSLKGDEGQQGIQGNPGSNGIDGDSAYHIAVAGGFVGTEAQWLLTLVGANGADGSQGAQGIPGNDGPSAEEVGAIAAGSTLGLQQSLLANAGQPALTVLAVGYTTTGKIQGVSLGNGNIIEAYATGADYNSGNVLYRVFKNLGQPFIFTGLSNGAIITSTQGYYGFADQSDAADMSPMGLLSYGLSFKKTFMFAFRNCNIYDPTGTSANQGWIHVVNGPLSSVLKLTDGSGVTIQGQENIELQPWQYHRLYTSGNQEYIIESNNPVMACHNANMDSNPHGRFYDSRLIMPLINDGITHPRSGFISALYNNTEVKFYVRDGAKGIINSTAGTGVSPGSPVDFDAAIGVGTGASDTDYEPDGATRLLATGLISAYSGADSAGLEASPLMPTSAMSQVVAQPLFIEDNGDGGNSGVSISSPYVGTARIYEWNFTTRQLDLAYTVPLNRRNVTVNSKEDQLHPSSGFVANESVDGAITLVGRLDPGVIIADVPVHVVVQSGITGSGTLPNQDEVDTLTIANNDDETLSLGWTPNSLKAEIKESFLDNILYKRVINTNGFSTWVTA